MFIVGKRAEYLERVEQSIHYQHERETGLPTFVDCFYVSFIALRPPAMSSAI
jgi:hypothetical protein